MRSRGALIILLGYWKMEVESRAAARRALDRDAAAVAAHDALADGEPKAHAFFLLGRKKRPEDVRQRRLGDADAAVGDRDDDRLVRGNGGGDLHLAAVRH